VCTQIRWDRQCDSNTVECSTDGATTLNVHYMYYVTISLPHVGITKTKKRIKKIYFGRQQAAVVLQKLRKVCVLVAIDTIPLLRERRLEPHEWDSGISVGDRSWFGRVVYTDVGHINKVELSRARLVLGLVTIFFGSTIPISPGHSGPLSPVIPPWVGAMSSLRLTYSRHQVTVPRYVQAPGVFGRCMVQVRGTLHRIIFAIQHRVLTVSAGNSLQRNYLRVT